MARITITEDKPIDVGKYEVFINKYDDVDTDGGFHSSRVMVTVRDDVPGMEAYANKNIFFNIRDTWGWMFSAIGRAVGLDVGTEFEDLSEFLSIIKGKSMVVNVVHTPNSDDPERFWTNIKGFSASTLVPYEVPVATDVRNIDISDDDLPF